MCYASFFGTLKGPLTKVLLNPAGKISKTPKLCRFAVLLGIYYIPGIYFLSLWHLDRIATSKSLSAFCPQAIPKGVSGLWRKNSKTLIFTLVLR